MLFATLALMGKLKVLLLLLAASLLALSMQSQSLKKLKKTIIARLAAQPGDFAVAFKDLQTGQTLNWHEHLLFHAASTMKTAVLIEALKQSAAGNFALTDSITIKNDFTSIVDSSHFMLNPGDDGQQELYQHIGQASTIYDLLYQMIIRSSNLATNLMIQKLGATNITATIRQLGAKDMLVLRGVEDQKAFDQGLNNVVTAADLLLLFEKIADRTLVSAAASDSMIHILLNQEFNDIIPARLPPGVKVAHKTGSITGVAHDSGIIYLPDGKKYVLVLLSKNLSNEKAGVDAMAEVSELLYHFVAR